MIEIKYRLLTASFTIQTLKWASTNKRFEKLLNDYVPTEGDLSVGASWFEGPLGVTGIDGIALKKVIGFLGRSVKVIAYDPDPIPEEKEGVVV